MWPLALMVQGLTASTAEEQADMLRLLLKTQCSNGLMHESGKTGVAAVIAAIAGVRPDCAAQHAHTLSVVVCLPAPAVNADDLTACSRDWFGWANSLLVALVESSLGIDCAEAAEEQHRLNIAAQEKSSPSDPPKNGSPQDPAYFASLLSTIAYDRETLTVPAYVGQHAKAL